MTIRLSEGLRDKMLGLEASIKAVASNSILTATLAYVGGAGAHTITTSAGSFITAGFSPGDKIYTYGSTTGGNNLNGVVLTGVAAGVLTFANGAVANPENFVATTFLVCCKGGSLKDVFKDGVLKIYSGSQPATANAAATGTLLATITASSGAFVAGAFGNGLEFGDAASGSIAKSSAETWSGVAANAGAAGYFRLCANPADDGLASTVLPRIDGSIGTSGADLNLSTTSIVAGQTYTIDTFALTQPAFYGA